jgi:hypothetical protein
VVSGEHWNFGDSTLIRRPGVEHELDVADANRDRHWL